ncbi:MAG: hypothetical protein PHX83_17125, partial [Acidobacteriia bacterium]|nr:hypothetical protein [Terriglobia bacterium]
ANGKRQLSLEVSSGQSYPLTIAHNWSVVQSMPVTSAQKGPRSNILITFPSWYACGAGIHTNAIITGASTEDFSGDADTSVPTTFAGGTISSSGAYSTVIVGTDWLTWNPQTSGIHLLRTFGSYPITLTFTALQQAVAVKAEPNAFNFHNITITAFDEFGIPLGTYTESINGFGGAAFIGIVNCAPRIASVQIASTGDSSGFAFSNVTWSGSIFTSCFQDIKGNGDVQYNPGVGGFEITRCSDGLSFAGQTTPPGGCSGLFTDREPNFLFQASIQCNGTGLFSIISPFSPPFFGKPVSVYAPIANPACNCPGTLPPII